MSGIDINRFLNKFGQNYQHQKMLSSKAGAQPAQISGQLSQKAQESVEQSAVQNLKQVTTANLRQSVQMNTLQSIDRAIYAKDLMQMPKNINEFIYMVQRGLTQSQFNQLFANQLAAQKNSLSQLQAQILAQLQGLTVSTAKEAVNFQLASQLSSSLKNLEILSGGMINLNEISLLFQKNGKEALTKLIMAMTEASKAGVTDLSQMKDMAKLINASISIAAENNPQKTLKLLLMLYLPWLPLEDGVGFDLEVEQKSNAHEESDSILNITISTVNFGTVAATLILETSNSVQISIECSENFPKPELQLRIDKEKTHYAVDSVVSYEVNKDSKTVSKNASVNVNMSQTTEINPYLLLMAHSIIKHVIDIDNNKSLGIMSHTDKF